jgi:hypothetical protein
MSSWKILTDNIHTFLDEMNEQGTNDDQVIMWLPKMLHKAATEFFAVWTIALSCWKNCILPPYQLN